jgi:hypothetical protein
VAIVVREGQCQHVKQGVPPQNIRKTNEGEVVRLERNYWHASGLVWLYVGEKTGTFELGI